MSRDWRDDRGSVSIFIAVLGAAFIIVAGLAIDGGRKLGGLSEARHLADNAARAGAQAIDTDGYRSSGVVTLDPTAAAQAANEYLASTGHTGVVSIAGDTVTVTVQVVVDTRILPGPYTVSATEAATATLGIEGALS